MQNLKNITKLILIILLSTAFLIGCAALTKYGKLETSARKNYQQGNFDTAFYQCAKALRISPKYGKAQVLIQDVFKAATKQHENKIEQLKGSTAKFKWDDVVDHYEKLEKMNKEIETLPKLINKKTKETITIKTKSYYNEILVSKNNAAEVHYQEGDKLSKIDNIDKQKQAAKEFKKANYYVPGYKDASERYETCRKAGIKRMAIIPFENKSGKTQYGAVEEMITDDIITNVMSNPEAMEFLEIISRDQLMQVLHEQELGMTGTLDEQTAVKVGKVLGVHELLNGKITQISHTPARTSNKTIGEKASVVVGQETYYDKKGKKKKRNVWGDVYARVTEYKKTAGASIIGSYKILDVASARIKKSESFKGKSNFSCEWGKFSGNERALSRHSRSLVSKTEGYAPPAEELVNRAGKNLSNSLAATLILYAK